MSAHMSRRAWYQPSIVDTFGLQKDVLCSPVERANQYFNKKGMATIQCRVPYHHGHASPLERSWFFSYRWLARFCLRRLHPDTVKTLFNPLAVCVIQLEGGETEVDCASERNWFVTMGDPH